MKLCEQYIMELIKDYSIKSQQRLLRLVNQICPVVTIGRSSILLKNTHVISGINHSSKHHLHHFLEIHMPYNGAGFVLTEGNQHHFHFGEFTANPPEQVHYWEATQAPIPMLIFCIRLKPNTENSEPIDQLLIDFFQNRKIVHTLPDDFFLLYRKLLAEASTPQIGMAVAMNNYLSQIILLLARATVSPRKIKQKILIEPINQDERLIFMVDQFLKANLATEVRLVDIAQQFSLSPGRLTQKYQKIKGTSIKEELNRMRMYRAEEFLRESNLPIKEIAWKCGIPDTHYFCRKFKAFFQQSPGEYRHGLDLRALDLSDPPAISATV